MFARARSGWIAATLGLAVSLLGAAESVAQPAPGGSGPCTTYETFSDFQNGTLFNLELFMAPDSDAQCLRLKDGDQVKPWPFIGVAISGTNGSQQVRRGAIMRIAVEDMPLLGISEGDVLGEYFTAPGGRPSDPSRTTVDGNGNIWVGNRGESSPVNGVPKGSITRIGLVLGGVRGDKVPGGPGGFTFVPNPLGDYLQGPFDYCTCEDRDGDGLIKTSRGYDHTTGQFNVDYQATALPWTNAAGADTNGGVATAEDECITAFVRTVGTQVRHISVDGANDVWVGSYTNRMFEKIDSTTATQVPGTVFTGTGGIGGYGGLVDSCGVLWSAQHGQTLMRYDPNVGIPVPLAVRNYGVAFDPATCDIWTSFPYDQFARRVTPSLVSTAFNLGNYLVPLPNDGLNRGITVHNGEVWVANSESNTLSRITTTGTILAPTGVPVSFTGSPPVAASRPHGVAVDSNGKIWAVNRVTHNATRIDPSIGVGAADLAVDLGPNAFPYNYSDMTGDMLLKTAPQGSWTFIHDGGKPGCKWSTLDWTAILTGGSSVMVQVRASDSPLPSGPWTVVQANTPFTGVMGQYLQVQVTLKRGTQQIPGTDCCRPFGEAILCSLTICKEAECTVDIESIVCALDGSGNVSVTLQVNNNSGVDAQRVLITPLPPGSPVVPMPNMFNVSIPDGGGAALKVNFSGLTSGKEFCFVVTLLDSTLQACCSVVVCFTPDCDCLQVRPETVHVLCSPDGVPGSYLVSFQFDNLTNDFIHHAYFYPPTGVTITPNYVPLVPPIPPLGTSQPITLTITGATPGQTLCFSLGIHDIHLMECCARDVCIEIPFCDDDPRFGACCYEQPGVPQPTCIVTSLAECDAIGGTYLGDNTTCTPNPCIPEPGDFTTKLTSIVNCCWPSTQMTTTTLTICNNSTIARTYGWSISSVAGLGCTNVIPSVAFTPLSGSVTIPAGGCVNIPITINCEFTIGVGVTIGCLEAVVTDLGTSQTMTASGIVRGVSTQPGTPLPSWCIGRPSDNEPVSILFGTSVNDGFTVTNLSSEPQSFFYTLRAGGTLRINGNDPGSEFSGYALVGPGETRDIRFEASFAEHHPLQVFDVVLFLATDPEGMGDRVAVGSIGFISVLEDPCPGDVNGDGSVGFNDLSEVLTNFGHVAPPEIRADINCDGVVDFQDLSIVLGAFGMQCP
ncbi:MAG: hypothetical protein EA379_01235 [Phycisphaerales bacterium]|nr:MAG: hypothetical protein EA379_01235 [Phycisphaerales bacterium]